MKWVLLSSVASIWSASRRINYTAPLTRMIEFIAARPLHYLLYLTKSLRLASMWSHVNSLINYAFLSFCRHTQSARKNFYRHCCLSTVQIFFLFTSFKNKVKNDTEVTHVKSPPMTSGSAVTWFVRALIDLSATQSELIFCSLYHGVFRSYFHIQVTFWDSHKLSSDLRPRRLNFVALYGLHHVHTDFTATVSYFFTTLTSLAPSRLCLLRSDMTRVTSHNRRLCTWSTAILLLFLLPQLGTAFVQSTCVAKSADFNKVWHGNPCAAEH